MNYRTVVAALAMLGSSGCGRPSPIAPSPPGLTDGPLTGTWTGTLMGHGPTRNLRLQLIEYAVGHGHTATGTFISMAAGGTSTGTVTGLTLDGRATLTLAPAQRPACPLASLGTVGNVELTLLPAGDRLSGDALFVECGQSVRGTANLVR
jgi:hypothetical protein